MKYFSDVTKQFYDSEKECLKAEHEEAVKKAKAEKEAAEKANARKVKAQKVEEAKKALAEAQKNYQDVLADFCKEYPEGYHQTISVKDFDDLRDILSLIF